MKYSIITINFNNNNGLQKTIESVVNQTCKDFEYIVIDGDSSDGSKETIQKYADQIDYWVSEKDNGIYNAMNKGILKAKGDYLNFMNSGDTFYDNNVLKNIVPYTEDTDIIQGMSYNSTLKISEYKEAPLTLMAFYEGSLAHQACFIKKDLLVNNPYREDFRIISDWCFFVEEIIIRNKKVRNAPLFVSIYDGQGFSSTNNDLLNEEKQKALKLLFPEKILLDYEHYNRKESPILELIPLFNRTNGLQNIIIIVVRTILWFYYRIIKRNTTLRI